MTALDAADYWADWPDAEMNRHFNPRVAVPDTQSHLDAFAAHAAETRRLYDMRRNIAYGEHERETYDMFPGIVGGPLHIFIHGGYWRALSKEDHSFVAAPLNGAGATVIVLNYPLAPEVTLSALVASAMRGVAHAIHHAEDYGASADRVHLSGHSAGAHLAAVAAAHDWRAHDLPAAVIRSAVLMSGIFDPRAALRIAVKDEIGLDDAEAAANNLLTLGFRPRPHVQILLAAGGEEPAGWIRQSETYRDIFGIAAPLMLVEGANHFSLLDSATDPKSQLCRAMLALMSQQD